MDFFDVHLQVEAQPSPQDVQDTQHQYVVHTKNTISTNIHQIQKIQNIQNIQKITKIQTIHKIKIIHHAHKIPNSQIRGVVNNTNKAPYTRYQYTGMSQGAPYNQVKTCEAHYLGDTIHNNYHTGWFKLIDRYRLYIDYIYISPPPNAARNI